VVQKTHLKHSQQVGKWHLGMKSTRYLPSQRGFNHSFCFYQGIKEVSCKKVKVFENIVSGNKMYQLVYSLSLISMYSLSVALPLPFATFP